MIQNTPLDSDYNVLQQINIDNSLSEVTVNRGIGSYFPILVSLGITSYGFFLFLSTIVESQIAISFTLVFLAILILFIENHRTGYMADFLGSLLEKKVNEKVKTPFFSLVVAIMITSLFVGLDTWGALQSADKIERMLVSGIVKNSEEYKLLNEKAQSGVEATKIHLELMEKWRADRQSYYSDCDVKWRVPTYRTRNQQCKDRFTQVQPKASDIKTSSTIDTKDYADMETKAKETVSGYRSIFFWVFLGFSILLNYFAMASLFNQFRSKDKELTEDVILELQTRKELMEVEKLDKLQSSSFIQQQKVREKNIIDVQIEEQHYNIKLAKQLRSLQTIQQIPEKIYNDDYSSFTQQKAGFVLNPLSSSKLPKSDYELVKELFKNGRVNKDDKLALKKDIIDIRDRQQEIQFRKVCKELKEIGVIEYRDRKGYYALVDFETLKEIFPA